MAAHDNHAHDHGHGAAGESHGSVKSYLIGFLLAAVLTIIPFWAVMHGDLPRFTTGVIIVVAAVLQILVHLVFFLHLDRSSEQRWNVSAAAFTLVVIGIIVAGSLWVMHNMNVHMMH